MKKLCNAVQIALFFLLFSSAVMAKATDSTAVLVPKFKPVAQPYLLDSNTYSTNRSSYFNGNYAVNINVDKRCSGNTTPKLITSIDSIQAYGALQGIEGVNSNISFDADRYTISGSISAPVNVAGAADNGVTVRWQIWCEPIQTA